MIHRWLSTWIPRIVNQPKVGEQDEISRTGANSSIGACACAALVTKLVWLEGRTTLPHFHTLKAEPPTEGRTTSLPPSNLQHINIRPTHHSAWVTQRYCPKAFLPTFGFKGILFIDVKILCVPFEETVGLKTSITEAIICLDQAMP